MPVEDPRGSPQNVGLHPFDVNLENCDLSVDDLIEPCIGNVSSTATAVSTSPSKPT
jgi:hypothetical protein